MVIKPIIGDVFFLVFTKPFSHSQHVVSGQSYNPAEGLKLAIWRYNADGSLDSNFGSGATAGLGYVLFQAGGLGATGRANPTKSDYAWDMLLDSQGRYVLNGASKNPVGGREHVIINLNFDLNGTTVNNGVLSNPSYSLCSCSINAPASPSGADKNHVLFLIAYHQKTA